MSDFLPPAFDEPNAALVARLRLLVDPVPAQVHHATEGDWHSGFRMSAISCVC